MARHSIYFVLSGVCLLICIGLVMLFSTGAFARDSHGDIYYFVKRQAIWLGVGVAACIVAASIDYHFWERTWKYFFGLAVVLLVLCFVPPLGMRINGSWRWLNFGVMTFQPSELGKIASIFFLAWWFTKFEKRGKTFWGNLLYFFVFPGMVVSVLLGLIACEVDLGTTALIGLVMFATMFLVGTSLWLLVPLVALGVGGVLFVAINIPQRAGRLLAFLNLEEYRLTEGLQQWQGLIALGSGGIGGLGLGEGRQKMSYLPYAHTDFIFPMIGEELGMICTLLVVMSFLALFLAGSSVAANAKDRFGALLSFAIVMTITVQALINLLVTTALLPNKGMPLPFISYGGSNLVVCLFMVGILINVHRQISFVPVRNRLIETERQPAIRR